MGGAAILSLHPDIYYHIFSILLPTPDPTSLPMDDAQASSYFATTVPYNAACVCRSWRGFMLSSPSFWWKFSLSLMDPSRRTLLRAASVISQHMISSQDLPLMCSVRITGTFSETIAQQIAFILSEHQMRWKTVNLWFDSTDTNTGAAGRQLPSSTIYLVPNDLSQLEELTSNYGVGFRSRRTETDSLVKAGPIRSLARLTLQMYGDYLYLHQWLSRTPNVRELNLTFSGARSTQVDTGISALNLSKLEKLHINHQPGDLKSAGSAGAFMVRYLTCVNLRELFLRVDGISCIGRLSLFLERCVRLENLVLHIVDGQDDDPGRAALLNEVIAAISALDELSALCISSRFLGDIGPLLGQLGNPEVLPKLERLEFHFLYTPTWLFLNFIEARWRLSEGMFKSFRLLNCSTKRFGVPFKKFKPGDGLARLPQEWEAVRNFVADGLRLEIE